ncbi:MAG: methyl-accepting chemotaxis protein [Lachnospiraceae bacterium]|nr:methyl-accepting chemotaxis protein [Lachnospiraceae bacterium]
MGKKRKQKLILKVIFIALAALALVCTILTVFSGIQIKKSYHTMYEEELRISCIQLRDELDDAHKGDWTTARYFPVSKGGTDISAELQEMLDYLHGQTGLEYTLFIGKTRAVTTLVDAKTGERIVGTDASEKVIKQCLEGGEEFYADKLTINNLSYGAYYVPLYQGNGDIAGMVFAGRPSSDATKAVTANVSIMVILAVIVAGTICIFGIMIANKTSRKMSSLADTLHELATGNLNAALDPSLIKRSDELGAIAESCETLKEKLSDIITDTMKMATDLHQSSEDLNSSAEQASTASGQVTNAIDDISKGAVSQAESIETATTDTSKIGDNIDEISERVKELDSAAEGMKKSCDNAMQAMEKLIVQNNNVTESVKEISRTIDSTNESAKSIDSFSQAITDIATQTNLLSLNASIEAARAGEAGRGFAVVADEIRALADQSKGSADKIKDIVDKLLSDSEASVSVMQKLNENFHEQSSHLDNTKNDMVDMMNNVNNVSDSSSLISKRVAELDKAKEDLLSIIADLSAISEENAASAEETNASMEELNATFTLISNSADELRKLAVTLNETISYFKV